MNPGPPMPAKASTDPKEDQNAAVFTVDLSVDRPEISFIRGLGDCSRFEGFFSAFDLDAEDLTLDDQLFAATQYLAQEFINRKILDGEPVRHIALIEASQAKAVEMLSDFGLSTMQASANREYTDAMPAVVSNDRSEIIFRFEGSACPMFLVARPDNTADIFSVESFDGGTPSAQIPFYEGISQHIHTITSLAIIHDWQGSLDGLDFASLLQDLRRAEHMGEVEEIVERVAEWVFFCLGAKLDDPFVSIQNGQLTALSLQAPIALATGTEAELKRLLSIAAAIDFRAFPNEVDSDEVAWDRDADITPSLTRQAKPPRERTKMDMYLHASWRGRQAGFDNGYPMSMRGKILIHEILAWFNPRGCCIRDHATNRRSSAQLGPATRYYQFAFEEFGTGHSFIAALNEMRAFLKTRGYGETEIQVLLQPDPTVVVKPGD